MQFLLGLALFALFLFSLCFYWGGPQEPQDFEVDVTDQIAEWAKTASAGSQNLPSLAMQAVESGDAWRKGPAAAEGLDI